MLSSYDYHSIFADLSVLCPIKPEESLKSTNTKQFFAEAQRSSGKVLHIDLGSLEGVNFPEPDWFESVPTLLKQSWQLIIYSGALTQVGRPAC